MAINTQDLLMKVQPLSPIKLDMGGGAQMSMERERLKLMREQFENTKQQQAQQLELSKLEENGRMARERMQQDRLAQAQIAQAEAAKKEEQTKVLAKFTELNGAGDVEGARAMVPLMDSLGMDIELEGEENGLPRYRIGPDPEAGARDAGAIGYPTNESGNLTETPGVASTEDAFRRAQGAMPGLSGVGSGRVTSEATGTTVDENQGTLESGGTDFAPARAPDQPDYTGAVPKNVIDTGAIAAQTRARLDPALSGLVNAYPEAYRESAESTAGAVRGLGLPAVKTVEMFEKMRGAPDSIARGETAAAAQSAQFNQKRGEPSVVESQRLVDMGMKQAKSSGDQIGIKTSLEGRKAAQQIQTVLTNDDPNDDRMIGSLISSMLAEKGPKTEGDIKRALGMDSQSTLDQVVSYFNSKAFGGLSDSQKEAILGVVKGSLEIDNKKIGGFLDSIDNEIGSEDMDQNVGRGWRRYRDTVIPRELREEHEAKKKGRTGASSQPQPFRMTDDAEAGGDMGPVEIPKVSRIAFEHNNPGKLKFADQEGAEKGEEASDGGNYARFKSVDEGLQALRRQIELDAERGLVLKDFILKYATPGSNDSAGYLKKALDELRAKENDSIAEIDPYDLMRFIARHESGTEMPSQYDDTKPDPANPPVTGSAGSARMRELLKKGGY